MIGLTRTMAVQYGRSGIRTNAIAPGVIETEMTSKHWNSRPFQRLNQEMTPMDRAGTSADVANAIYFLCSEAGSYINGQVLTLDGGWSTTKYLEPNALLCDRV
jgi:3-oxoacyl-[acyl-carrier protein] reductase